jgi:hypothetical protein
MLQASLDGMSESGTTTHNSPSDRAVLEPPASVQEKNIEPVAQPFSARARRAIDSPRILVPLGIHSFNDPTDPSGTTLAMLENTLGIANEIGRYPETGLSIRVPSSEIDALSANVPLLLDREMHSHFVGLRGSPNIDFVVTTYADSRSFTDSSVHTAHLRSGVAALRDAAVSIAPAYAPSRSAANTIPLLDLENALVAFPHRVQDAIAVLQRPRVPYQLAPPIPHDVSVVRLTHGISDDRKDETKEYPALVAVPALREAFSEYLTGRGSQDGFYRNAARIMDGMRPGQSVALLLFDLALLSTPLARERFLTLYRGAASAPYDLSLRSISAAADAVRGVTSRAPAVPLRPSDLQTWSREEGARMLDTPPALHNIASLNAYVRSLALIADDRGFEKARVFASNPELCRANGVRPHDCRRHLKAYEFLLRVVEDRVPMAEVIANVRSSFLRLQLGMYEAVARFRYDRER